MNRNWTKIPRWSCQSYTYPIWPWGVPTLGLGYCISEPWIVTVWRILRGGTQISPSQVLENALHKIQLLGPIGYVLLGQILRYHELGQVSHDLGGRRDLGNVMCRGMWGSS